MPFFRIDSRNVKVPAGSTILDAARQVGIEIPTLCHMDGFDAFTSCMVCLVEDMVSHRLIPSCSAPVQQGMVVETNNERVRDARRNMLELLLREHVGDCESPCMRACPVHLDIPVVLRHIAAGSDSESFAVQGYNVPFIAVLEHICPAPCERVCRRRSHDEAVSIRLAMRAAVIHEEAMHGAVLRQPEIHMIPPSHTSKPSRSNVAVIGAGPAGLSTAYNLCQHGHACTVFDNRTEPGGTLRYEIPEKRLPVPTLEKEIDYIRDLDVTFRMNTEVGRDIEFKELLDRFDAVVIASGAMKPETEKVFGIEVTKQGIHINRSTFETSLKGVFAGGSAVRPLRIAARAVADGRSIARSVRHYLDKKEVSAPDKKFDCRMGVLHEGELNGFLKGVSESQRTSPSKGALSGYSFDEAVREARRCLHCDCGGKNDCMLRDYADEYGAVQKHNTVERIRFERIAEHPNIVFEPSKCIKCGTCVRISAAEDEPFGLSFSDRSFNLRVTVPFGESLSRGLEKSALRCARACPTGALTEKLETTKHENRKAP